MIQENVIDILIARFEARYMQIMRRNHTPSPESHTIERNEAYIQVVVSSSFFERSSKWFRVGLS
jgi:predicted alpha/beta-hydrolase family hydrolase